MAPSTGDGSRTSRVVIVDDHGLVAQALAVALADDLTAVTLLPVHDRSIASLAESILRCGPDLVIADLDLGGGRDGVDLVARVATETSVVVLTGTTDPAWLGRAVEAGAIGLLSKDGSVDDVSLAVAEALRTGTLLSKHERDRHLAALRSQRGADRRRLEPFADLTPREAEVLGSLVRGSTVDAIAEVSVVSRATVRTQVRSILSKLGVRSQVAAVALARDAGWVPPQER